MSGKKRFDVTQVIKNFDGSDAVTFTRTDERCKTCRQFLGESVPFTLREALVQCLTSDEISPMTGRKVVVPGPISYQRIKLALRIDAAKDTIRLSDKQIEDIEEQGPKFLASVAYYRVANFLGIEDDDYDDDSGPEEVYDIDDEEDGEEKESEDDQDDSV